MPEWEGYLYRTWMYLPRLAYVCIMSRMKHFIYSMKSGDPAPAGGGDIKSWFLFYKWDVDGETFVPFPQNSLSPDVVVDPGDRLWFILDSHPIGSVPISETRPSLMNNTVEFVYDTREMRAALHDKSHVVEAPTGLAENELAERMNQLCALFESTHPPKKSD